MGFKVNIRRENDKSSIENHDSDTPFCIAVLGDFSGRFNQHPTVQKPLAQRKLIAIDRDNFDEVMAGFNLSLMILPTEHLTDEVTIAINELDDFHPDSLYENLEVFSKLRSIRRRLQNNSSFDEAAREIMGWLVTDEQPDSGSETAPALKQQETLPAGELLDNILDTTQQTTSELENIISPGGIDRLVKEIIAPYVEPSASPRQQEMIDAVDEAIAGHMRQILHHPSFQSLEASWRSLYFLISRVDTDTSLKIYLLDVSKQELQKDLGSDENTSVMHKLFCEPAVNDTPWSLLVGNYSFADKIEDVLLLAQLGAVAKQAQAPFLAAAKETLAGCTSFGTSPDADDWQYELKPGVDKAWEILRHDPVADYLGLALPRFLLRLPYGKKSSPIEAFTFEEMTSDGDLCHECLLWGNAAILKAEQLARAFAENGWNMKPADVGETDNLPVYYYQDNGETVSMPCAEIFLTEKGGSKMSKQGLIPLWSVKNRDAVRSNNFTSMAVSGKNLPGRWIK